MSYDIAWVIGFAAMSAGLILFIWLLAQETRSRRRIRRRLKVPLVCTRPELGHDGPCNGYPSATCWQHISVCPIGVHVWLRHDDGADKAPTHFRFRRSK